MLPKTKRLNLKKDFKWAASGKKIQTKYLTLFLKTGENTFPKIGIALSSKVFNKATQRNKAKRIVSKVFEVLYNDLPVNINIVALPNRGVLDVKLEDVLVECKNLNISN